jgi:lipopolysaccharide transport system ATP-binding protein
MQTIKVENLSKLYYLGERPSNSLRDALMSFVRKPGFSRTKNELWALRDINFAVKDGETLGIIGPNGAGKSTLLKILSRITKPTSGTAEIRGRVGSLLEVGTGFHNELSGRENIYLNGAILGMKRVEIDRKFDEIVAFSEIEKFLDTSVKHYSSGMYMRLAFSVAAHLEPEVLIVDEVLAVGDVGFQKKCLSKMRDVGQSGRTVLFVSHDITAVARLCSRVIWLKNGNIVADGEVDEVLAAYLHEQSQAGSERAWKDPLTAPGNDVVRLRNVRICDEVGKTVASVDIRRPLAVEITYEVLRDKTVLSPSFHLYDEGGTCIFVSLDQDKDWQDKIRESGIYTSRAWIPGNLLAEGGIFVTVVIATHQPLYVHIAESEVVTFRVVDQIEGDSARGQYAGKMPGLVRPILKWETEFRSESV